MPRDRDTSLITAAVRVSAVGDPLLWIPLTLHLQEQTGSGVAVAVPVLAALAGLAWHLRLARWPDPALAAEPGDA